MCLCRTLAGDVSGALVMLDRFNDFEGAKDPPDVLAMAILSHVLGRCATVEPIPKYVTDGYEQRVTAAVSLMHSLPAGVGTRGLLQRLQSSPE